MSPWNKLSVSDNRDIEKMSLEVINIPMNSSNVIVKHEDLYCINKYCKACLVAELSCVDLHNSVITDFLYANLPLYTYAWVVKRYVSGFWK